MNLVGWGRLVHFRAVSGRILAGQTTARKDRQEVTPVTSCRYQLLHLWFANTGRDRPSHELARRDRSISCAPMIVCTVTLTSLRGDALCRFSQRGTPNSHWTLHAYRGKPKPQSRMDVIHRTVSIARTASAIVIYQLILDPTRGDTLPTYRDDTLLDLTTRYSVLRPPSFAGQQHQRSATESRSCRISIEG